MHKMAKLATANPPNASSQEWIKMAVASLGVYIKKHIKKANPRSLAMIVWSWVSVSIFVCGFWFLVRVFVLRAYFFPALIFGSGFWICSTYGVALASRID